MSQGQRFNLKRGLFRLWLFVSIPWLLGFGAISGLHANSYFTNKRLYDELFEIEHKAKLESKKLPLPEYLTDAEMEADLEFHKKLDDARYKLAFSKDTTLWCLSATFIPPINPFHSRLGTSLGLLGFQGNLQMIRVLRLWEHLPPNLLIV